MATHYRARDCGRPALRSAAVFPQRGRPVESLPGGASLVSSKRRRLPLDSFPIREQARGERGVDERERDLSVLVALLRERHSGEHPLRFDKCPVAAIGECGVLDVGRTSLRSRAGRCDAVTRSGRPNLGNDLANGFANGRVSNQGT